MPARTSTYPSTKLLSFAAAGPPDCVRAAEWAKFCAEKADCSEGQGFVEHGAPDMVRMLHMSAEQFQAVTNADAAGQQLRAMAVVTWRPAAKERAVCGPHWPQASASQMTAWSSSPSIFWGCAISLSCSMPGGGVWRPEGMDGDG